MPNTLQRSESGKARYEAGSAIALRNGRLSLAKRISPIRKGSRLLAKLDLNGRTTTANDYVTLGEPSGAHVDAGRSPYLLVEDTLNPGSFSTIAVHDCFTDLDNRGTRCVLVLHAGEALLPTDTLIYWK